MVLQKYVSNSVQILPGRKLFYLLLTSPKQNTPCEAPGAGLY